jgi:hypothetical protein
MALDVVVKSHNSAAWVSCEDFLPAMMAGAVFLPRFPVSRGGSSQLE